MPTVLLLCQAKIVEEFFRRKTPPHRVQYVREFNPAKLASLERSLTERGYDVLSFVDFRDIERRLREGNFPHVDAVVTTPVLWCAEDEEFFQATGKSVMKNTIIFRVRHMLNKEFKNTPIIAFSSSDVTSQAIKDMAVSAYVDLRREGSSFAKDVVAAVARFVPAVPDKKTAVKRIPPLFVRFNFAA